MTLDKLHTTINRYNEAYRNNTSNTDILKEIVKLFDSLSAKRLEKSLEKATIMDLELWGDILSISAYSMTVLAMEDNTLSIRQKIEFIKRAELCYDVYSYDCGFCRDAFNWPCLDFSSSIFCFARLERLFFWRFIFSILCCSLVFSSLMVLCNFSHKRWRA